LYDRVEFEDAMFFFNTVLRERVHFDHALDDAIPPPASSSASDFTCVDHRFDGAAEVRLLVHYLRRAQPELFSSVGVSATPDTEAAGSNPPGSDGALSPLQNAVLTLSRRISAEIGSSFGAAVDLREGVRMGKAARGGWVEATEALVRAQHAHRTRPWWWRNADAAVDDATTTADIIGSKPILWRLASMVPREGFSAHAGSSSLS
jgi:hypothetical protein